MNHLGVCVDRERKDAQGLSTGHSHQEGQRMGVWFQESRHRRTRRQIGREQNTV